MLYTLHIGEPSGGLTSMTVKQTANNRLVLRWAIYSLTHSHNRPKQINLGKDTEKSKKSLPPSLSAIYLSVKKGRQ